MTHNTIPEAYHDLFTGDVVVTFVTVTEDHAPQGSPVWCDFDGTHILINTAKGRQKDKNVQVNKNVAVVAVDPTNPYRYVEVRGVVEEMTEDGALDVINKLAKIYRGADEYYGGVAPAELADQETRITYKVKPVRVIAQG